MLTPKQIEKAAEKIIPIWDDLKEWITLDLIDRITMRLGQNEDITFSSSEKHRISIFEELGGLVTELQNRITRTVNISEQSLKEVFLDYAETAARQDRESLYVSVGNTSENARNLSEINDNTEDGKLPSEQQNTAQNEPQTKTGVSNTMSDRMKDIANDAYLRTNGELRNFTGTTADSVQTQFIEELDKAYLKVASNTCSQWQAAREAIDNIIKYQGRVTYPSGHTDTIEVAVIRAIRTGIARMSAQLTLQSAEENGIDYVVVSGHLGARVGDGGENPGNHAWWQSKVYKINGSDKYPNLAETTGYPHDPHGLCGYNCRHSIALFDPDVMRNPFKQYGEEENKEYYENTQKQRKYEREIRKAKTEVNALARALEAATDPKLKESLQTSLDEAKAKRDNLLDEYKTFCNEHGFRAEYERMEIANRGRLSDSDKSGDKNSPGDGVANSAESGIINTRALADRDMASGMRKSAKIQLSDEDKKHLLSEIDSIQADRNVFVFRDGFGSGYSDERDKVFVSSNIFPSNDGSTHPRDLMSERAALAHEYYGHRANRGTTLSKGSWNDEFRASYMAAKNCPNLSDEDKYYLILDALERAKEQGVSIKYNDFIRGILYGY